MKKYFYFIILLFLIIRCDVPDNDSFRDKRLVDTRQLSADTKIIQPDQDDKSSNELLKDHNSLRNKSFVNSLNKKTRIRTGKDVSGHKPSKADSLRIAKLTSLRKRKIEIDLNEPLSKDYLLSSVNNGKYNSMITLSREKFLKINFDNDILNYTDRFYTNGIRFDLISPVFHQFPLSKLLVPYWRSGINYYGISLVQNMYTPSSTKVDGILYGDRPYAAYLYFGTFKITNDPVNKLRQKSEIDLGVIGPFSFGEYIQKSFHNEVPTNSIPLGWEYQVKNDLVLNYNYEIEKGIIEKRNFDFSINGTGALGSLYTNVSGGFLFRAGIQNPYFVNLGQAKKRMNLENSLKNTQFIFFITSRGKFIGYDATLQGGFFNKSSVYNIPEANISRFVYQGSAGLTFIYGGFRFDVEQFILSPEFKKGWWHKWVHIGFTISL